MNERVQFGLSFSTVTSVKITIETNLNTYVRVTVLANHECLAPSQEPRQPCPHGAHSQWSTTQMNHLFLSLFCGAPPGLQLGGGAQGQAPKWGQPCLVLGLCVVCATMLPEPHYSTQRRGCGQSP